MIPANERLVRKDDFRLISENGANYFVYRGGKKVLTDKIGRAIWMALPRTEREIFQAVKWKWLVSERLVREFLYVFLCAGMVGMEKGVWKSPAALDNPREPDTSRDRDELVSIVLVTYNGARYIRKCLRSILAQTHSRIEVIVVDNHSSDETVDIIRRDFPKVRLFPKKKNRHYAGGIHFGIRQATGEYLLLLNQDTMLDRDCVRRLCLKAGSDPGIGAVTPLMKFMELPGFINGLGNQINNQGWGTDNFIHCVDVGQFKDLAEIPSACFGAVLLRRAALDEVGLPDRGYGSFYEDVDWSLRCWLGGWRIVPQAEAVVYHEFGASYLSRRKLTFVVRNRLRLVLKIFEGRVMLGFLKNYMREDLRNGLSLFRNRHFGPAFCYIRAYMSLAFSLPGIFLKRSLFMSKKVRGLRERDILQKNPTFYCCLNLELNKPEIDVAVIRRYYRQHITGWKE